jgi:hypothetical protein
VDSQKKRFFEAVLMVVKDKVLASVGIRMCSVSVLSDLAWSTILRVCETKTFENEYFTGNLKGGK